MTHDVAAVASHFRIPGRFRSAARYGAGHINDTYLAIHDTDGTSTRHIVQRVNHEVFTTPVALMENVARVTTHVRARLEAEGADDIGRRVLTLVPTESGETYHLDEAGNLWRTYEFIESARTLGTTDDRRIVFEAARAVGGFLARLVDLPGPRLHDTIPGFHDTPGRLDALRRAVRDDPHGRLEEARPEVDFALERAEIAGAMHSRGLPERVTHNDTKLDNVMIDEETDRALCVIDLDTVMPGLAPYDFGEMVRSSTSPVRESDRNLDGVTMRMPFFEALTRGFLAATADVLTAEEIDSLVLGGKLMTAENGIRFLEDHLRGDVYFRVHRPGQNLDRARVQFRLVASIEEQEDAMRRLIDEVAASTPG